MCGFSSSYTGGNSGWGDMVLSCSHCGCEVARFECDEDGIIIGTVFDCVDSHDCETDEEE